MRQSIAALSEAQRAAASGQACALLLRQKAWREADSVLLYAPMSSELDLWPLLNEALAAGKTVALPRFLADREQYEAGQVCRPGQDLKTGRFGIREPAGHCPVVAISRLDLLLVPGVAFDVRGRRLGRGKGFFDQLLVAACGRTCGVGFDEQIVDEIPVEPHDISVNCILTPTRWIEL